MKSAFCVLLQLLSAAWRERYQCSQLRRVYVFEDGCGKAALWESMNRNIVLNQEAEGNCIIQQHGRVRRALVHTACVVCFLLLAVLVYFVADRVLLAKEGETLSSSYYSYEPGTFDVILIGPSLMKNGVQPVELWENYGIAAYNLACGNQSLACSYYLLEDALSRDNPELVVLEVTYAEEAGLTRSDDFVHYITDRMPWNDRFRYEMIQALIPEEKWLEFYLPFYAFHSRWKEITAEDFAWDDYQDDTLGSTLYSRTVSKSAELFERYDADGSLQEIPRQYLQKIIDLCRENGTELLLISCPVSSANGDCDEAHFNARRAVMRDVAALAANEGVTFLNFLETPDALYLDGYTDYSDGVHLNMFGAAKLTDFLGSYLSQNYSAVQDKRGDADTAAVLNDVAARYETTKRAREISTASRGDVAMEILNTYRRDEDLIYVAVGSELLAEELSSEIRTGLQELGLTLSAAASTGFDAESEESDAAAAALNFLAVIDGGIVCEQQVSTDLTGLTYEGTVDGLRIKLSAAGFLDEKGERLPQDYTFFRGDTTYTEELISLQGGSYSFEEAGIRIAVYSKETGSLIDCMNLSADGTSVTHWK